MASRRNKIFGHRAQKSYLLLLKIADRLNPLDTGIANTVKLYHQKIDKPTPVWWLFVFLIPLYLPLIKGEAVLSPFEKGD